MSVATLLETLQAEIQAKSAELPTLYAQLGLPATTLSEELTALQRRLVDGVDEVVNGRRREVNEWTERCKSVENRIKALLESTGAYVSYLDRAGSETVLPKRLEALSKDGDKLQSLYNNKLEQRIALMNHLKEFACVLGDDILPEDANVESTQDQPVDVSPDRLAKLERDIVQAKAEISRRRLSLAQTLDHLVWLHNELGVDLPTDPFTDGRVSNSRTLDSNASILECFVKGGSESLADVEPTKALLKWSTNRVTELETLKNDRELQIQNLYDQLELLWKRLGIDDKDVDEFVESWRGSTETVIEAYEGELERMLELKRSAMSGFIAKARTEIEEVWSELMYDESDRGAFEAFFHDDHSEELLILHEQELERLRAELKTKARLLAAVKKYKEICEEEHELAAGANDQSRLLGRGPRDPGRLLREEKMRKRVTKEKPRLEQDLIASISQWEEEQDKLFRVDGVRFLDILSDSLSKENKKRPRANTGPSRGTTPAPHPPTQSSAKRAKLDGAAYIPTSNIIRSSSVTPTPINAYHGTAGRQILGSRNGALNMATPTYFMAGKTPASGLPRLKSGLPIPQLVPTPTIPIPIRSQAYGKLGFGLPSTMNARVVSNTSSVSSISSRTLSQPNQRRESFRPRSSIGDKMAMSHQGLDGRARYTGNAAGLLQEEDEV